MTAGELGYVLRRLRWLARARGLAGLPDRALLDRFIGHRDEAAFAALMGRHGPMVLGVCRRVLGQEQDAEDAYQATFLVLACKAAAIRKREAVASWLHGVAHRIAGRLRRTGARQGAAHPLKTAEPELATEADVSWREARGILDEELRQLPEKYRAPLVLCYLEGKTRDEAAAQLGWTPGTLRGRLERGRAALRARLVRRGLTLSAALVPAALTPPVIASVPVGLAEVTCQAVFTYLTTRSMAGLLSGQVVSLAEGVIQAMVVTKFKIAIALLLLLGVAGTGTGMLTYGALAGRQPAAKQADPPKPAVQQQDQSKPEGEEQPRRDLYGDPLPPEALARMGTVQLRHDDHNGLVPAFSPDGRVLATVSHWEVRFWDTATGKLLLRVQEDRQGENYFGGSLLFSPDGKQLAAGVNKAIRLMDPNTGRVLQRLPQAGQVLVFSPDGKLLATKRSDSVYLWNSTTGEQVLHLQGQEGDLSLVAFSPDGKTLISFGISKKLCHWDVATGALRKSAQLVLPMWRTVELSPDGRTLAVVPYSREPVQLWDTATAQERCKLQGELGHAGYGITFTRDSRTLVTDWTESRAEHTTLSFWDPDTGKLFRRFQVPAHAGNDLHFAPDGRTLVSCGGRPTARLWDTTTGQELLKRPAHVGRIHSVAFTPDGRTLISAADNVVRLWDAATGQPQRELSSHRGSITGIAVLPDGSAVLSSDTDGYLRLHQLSTGKELRRFVVDKPREASQEHEYQVVCFGLAADGRTAASFSHRAGAIWADGKVREARSLFQIWDLATGNALFLKPGKASNKEVEQFSPDAKILLQYIDTQIIPTDGGGGYIPVPGYTHAVLREVATGRRLLALPQPDHCWRLEAFSPDGQTLATVTCRFLRDGEEHRGTDRHALRFWELATGQERLAIIYPEIGDQFGYEQLAYAPDGRTLATARRNRTIQVWDMATGQELLRRTGFPATVSCLAFRPDGKALASGHADSTILVWDLTPEIDRRDRPTRADARQVQAWFADLAGDDARKAHTAIWGLIAVPQLAVPLLRDRLQPAAGVPADQLQRLIADLDSSQFQRRESASKKLTEFEERAEPALLAALQANPSLELRRRIEALLAAPRIVRSPEALRHLRAVQVLEQIGTGEARTVLTNLSNGAPEARITQEAKAALERLARRPPP
jgi:RNA polymerase sigma factor (sigma-70 family)